MCHPSQVLEVTAPFYNEHMFLLRGGVFLNPCSVTECNKSLYDSYNIARYISVPIVISTSFVLNQKFKQILR